MQGLREFTSTAEMMAFYRELRERMDSLQPPPPPPTPPPRPPEPELLPNPRYTTPLLLTPMQRIIIAVGQHYGIPPSVLRSHTRTKHVVQVRGVAFYLGSVLLNLSTPRLGHALGRRDHTTVIHALRSVRARMLEDKDFARTVHVLYHALLDQE